ncbi:low molecular weight phosphatase family protein [Rhodococcus sp. IEGM 1408]|uniref:arsenate-mycothiol transferase ArsC n=1 Tax=Rhodococcus sp. IEGM 1408 TaxID=3082220 RepID=UPI002952FC7F|nr:low molecular weight phosphatase family protein [Rhodococcus sp. IEGM 1408]MDV7999737.1 low molecular weight phosphatase family protein [Rhodococcus sp. IEGM 1408]
MTPAAQASRPTVLFVCKSNRGKSQMAEALLRHLAGDAVEVFSAGTQPAFGKGPNDESVAALAEIGADMSGGTAAAVDDDVLRRADRVVVLGTAAQLEPVPGMRAPIEVWETDEPSERGIDGAARMALIRDDIATRVRDLWVALSAAPGDPAQ